MLREPESMEELIYFTQRNVGSGNVKAWVYKGLCPKCGKGRMGKPVDEKTGKVKIRAKEYFCPECGNTIEKKAYEETLNCEIKYSLPFGCIIPLFHASNIMKVDYGDKVSIQSIQCFSESFFTFFNALSFQIFPISPGICFKSKGNNWHIGSLCKFDTDRIKLCRIKHMCSCCLRKNDNRYSSIILLHIFSRNYGHVLHNCRDHRSS